MLFITAKRMENETRKQEIKDSLDKFIDESGMKNSSLYTPRVDFRITKWDAEQYGWPATYRGCGKISAINIITRNKKRISFKNCEHPGETSKQLKVDNVYVHIFQENDYDSKNFRK